MELIVGKEVSLSIQQKILEGIKCWTLRNKSAFQENFPATGGPKLSFHK